MKLSYINNQLENVEITLTPNRKDCVIAVDSVLLLTAYTNQHIYGKEILAYRGDSIRISDSAINLSNSKGTNNHRWVTLNAFTDFYKQHYPLTDKIDSIINLLYTKVPAGQGFFLKARDIERSQKEQLYNVLYATLHNRTQEYKTILDSLKKTNVVDENYKQWQLFNSKMFGLSYLQQIQFEMKNDQEAILMLNKLDLREQEAALSRFPMFKRRVGFFAIHSLLRLYQTPIQKGSQPHDDYTKVYDSIPNYYASLYPEHLKFECLKKIKESGTSKEFAQYVATFYEEAKDTVLINYVGNNLDIANDTGSDIVVYTDGQTNQSVKIHFEKQKGHLVYIDFWASWCGPCIAAMPASKALKADYENKGVRFIYLSLDKDFAKWRTANDGLELNESFLLIDDKDSGIVESLKINTIPRYLLYDKAGKLIHPNAPGPDTDDIRLLLDKNIAK